MLRRPFLAWTVLALSTAACSSSSSGSTSPDDTSGGDEASGRTGRATALGFDPLSLASVPGSVQPVIIRVEPPGKYAIRVALVGSALDASLDRSDAETTEDGSTTVNLSAPSSAATFTLRASVDSLIATLPVSIDEAFTSLAVVPSYSGKRTIESWIATVESNATCNAFESVPPSDGTLSAEAPLGAPLVVGNVPVGPRLRVTVRADHFAGGCAELPSSVPARPGSISIPVADRPLQTADVELPLRFVVTTSGTTGAAWTSAWTDLTKDAVDAFVNGASSDAAALLDAMYAETPVLGRISFLAARDLNDWDAALAKSSPALLGAGSGLRAAVRRWLTDATIPADGIEIDGKLSSRGLLPGSATYTVNTVGGVSPATAGLDKKFALTFAAASDDRLLFGGTASLEPNQFASALAVGAAQRDAAKAKTVPDALSSVLHCDAVASTLVASGGSSALGCDAACLASRCGDALAAMWDRATGALSSSGSIELSASGAADIDGSARPVALEGTWIGSAHIGSRSVKLGGPVSGGEDKPGTR